MNFKQYFHYVSLSVLSMIGLSFYIFADTLFIAGGVGSNGLAALNLCIPVYALINSTGLLIGMGGGMTYAICKGKKDDENGNIAFSHAVFAAIIAGIFFLLAGLFFSKNIAILLGADSILLPYTIPYLKTILLFAPAFLINNVLVCFVRNDGCPGLSMRAMLLGSLGNVGLDYLFIFPLKMGMFGAAFATGLAPIISLLVLSFHFIKKRNGFYIRLCTPKFKIFMQIFSLGLSSFINEFSSGIVMLFFNFRILKLTGNTGLAAYGIIANISLIAAAIFTGVAQGTQPLISQCYGASQKKLLPKLLTTSLITVTLFGILWNLVGQFFTNEIISIFNREQNTELQKIAFEGIPIYFTAFLFMGFNIVSALFFSAIEKPAASFFISLSRGLVLILLFLAVLPVFLKMNGIWLVIPCAEFVTFLLSAVLLRKNIRVSYIVSG